MENKKLNFNKSLKDLDGKEINNANMGKILANTLVSQGKGDPIKYWGWALNINEGKELDLDKSDFEHLKEFINNCDLPILTKAQLLLEF